MAAIGTFPTIRNVLYSGNNIHQFTATAAVKAGQVVSFAATGVSGAVNKAVSGTTGQPIGVALYDAAAGAKVAVACSGCVVYVANEDDTTGIDTGDVLMCGTNAVGGTVVLATLTNAGAVALKVYVCGIAIDDIAGAGTGRMLVKCDYMLAPNTA